MFKLLPFKNQLRYLSLEMRKRIYFSSENYKISVSLRRRSLRDDATDKENEKCKKSARPCVPCLPPTDLQLPNATHSYHCTHLQCIAKHLFLSIHQTDSDAVSEGEFNNMHCNSMKIILSLQPPREGEQNEGLSRSPKGNIRKYWLRITT